MVLNKVESFTEKEGDFEICGLCNEFVEITVLPELGGRILSLRDRRSGREWMDRPEGQALFRNDYGDDFSKGTFAGADECLPTIDACRWEGRDLPDHGECWASAWTLDSTALDEGQIRTTLDLPRSPLCFERTVTLDAPHEKLAYRLTSRSDQPERCLWAFHPLYPLCPGDRLELPGNAPAPECAPGASAKVFYPATEGRVSLVRASGNRLTTTLHSNPPSLRRTPPRILMSRCSPRERRLAGHLL